MHYSASVSPQAWWCSGSTSCGERHEQVFERCNTFTHGSPACRCLHSQRRALHVPAAQAASGAAAAVSDSVVTEPRPADPGAANGAPGGSSDAAGAPPKSTAYPFTELEAKWQARHCPEGKMNYNRVSANCTSPAASPWRRSARLAQRLLPCAEEAAHADSCALPLCVWQPRTQGHARTGPCS